MWTKSSFIYLFSEILFYCGKNLNRNEFYTLNKILNIRYSIGTALAKLPLLSIVCSSSFLFSSECAGISLLNGWTSTKSSLTAGVYPSQPSLGFPQPQQRGVGAGVPAPPSSTALWRCVNLLPDAQLGETSRGPLAHGAGSHNFHIRVCICRWILIFSS